MFAFRIQMHLYRNPGSHEGDVIDQRVCRQAMARRGERIAPTMTVYSPSGKNSGVAVIVFPGRGYEDLAIDLEGTEVCDWLTSKGITCVR